MNKDLTLSSRQSMIISLKAVKDGTGGLSEHRLNMLKNANSVGKYRSYNLNTLTTNDIAYLTAFTGHEFAILRGKHEDILFHGDQRHCHFIGNLAERLRNGSLKLYAHSHPAEDIPVPSMDDRKLLQEIHQNTSLVVSATTGRVVEFSANMFEDLGGGCNVDFE